MLSPEAPRALPATASEDLLPPELIPLWPLTLVLAEIATLIERRRDEERESELAEEEAA
jgi:hypothetical protein